MGKPKPKDIDVPDPRDIMRTEAEYNRVNTSGPFGEVSWDGNTQRTELSPQMQQLQDRMFGLAMQDSQQVETPDFLRDIAGGIMSNVGQRYGVGSKPGVEQTQPMPQLGSGIQGQTPGINPQAPNINDQAAQLRRLIADAPDGDMSTIINSRIR